MKTVRAIGLMSGTSMDGIDVAALATDGERIAEFGPGLFVPYPAPFRRTLETALEIAKAIRERDERPGSLAEIEREITLRHADAVAAFRAAEPDWADAALIGFHGQTVLHRPRAGLTVQLGDGALLAARTGLPVVYDMRANDMAHGGEGAPLAPAYHAALARSLPPRLAGRSPIVFVNIGGISNVTFLPRSGAPVAFDTGPGNTLIDQWVARAAGVPFDADGAIASEGGVVREVVNAYLASPFFRKGGPKSLDRNDFTLAPAAGLELADGARTLAAVTAEAILKSAEHLPEAPRLWIVCGGGRRNPSIVGDLRAGAAAAGAEVASAEEAGLKGDLTEAEAWAYLAVRSRRGLPLTWPTTTGCREPVAGGRFAEPPPPIAGRRLRPTPIMLRRRGHWDENRKENRRMTELNETVNDYCAAWNERDQTKRLALLEKCWAADGVWQDPLGEAAGRRAFNDFLTGFFERLPSAKIELTSGVASHHDKFAFAWRLTAKELGRVINGHDFGRLAPDGSIASITGFFDLPPRP